MYKRRHTLKRVRVCNTSPFCNHCRIIDFTFTVNSGRVNNICVIYFTWWGLDISRRDVSGPHSHSCTSAAALRLLLARSPPEVFSSISLFIASLFSANKQPAGRRQHGVISLHMASASYSYTHIWLCACHREIRILVLNLIFAARWDLPANASWFFFFFFFPMPCRWAGCHLWSSLRFQWFVVGVFFFLLEVENISIYKNNSSEASRMSGSSFYFQPWPWFVDKTE